MNVSEVRTLRQMMCDESARISSKESVQKLLDFWNLSKRVEKEK